MENRTAKSILRVKRTAHGKPYLAPTDWLADDAQAFTLRDALDFPGNRGLEEFKADLEAKNPDFGFHYDGTSLDSVAGIRSIDREVDRDDFMRCWLHQPRHAVVDGVGELRDPFLRAVPVRLSGKDRVRWWSGWFHYQWLIENSRREMEESGKRLQSLFEGPKPSDWRDVVEEAYYEQVQRRRLAIFERRREWWRVVRWGLTTVLGVVLTLWSGIQIWDRFFGG